MVSVASVQRHRRGALLLGRLLSAASLPVVRFLVLANPLDVALAPETEGYRAFRSALGLPDATLAQPCEQGILSDAHQLRNF